MEALISKDLVFKIALSSLHDKLKVDEAITDTLGFEIQESAPDCKRAGEERLAEKLDEARTAYSPDSLLG